jgi:hypothetical protein
MTNNPAADPNGLLTATSCTISHEPVAFFHVVRRPQQAFSNLYGLQFCRRTLGEIFFDGRLHFKAMCIATKRIQFCLQYKIEIYFKNKNMYIKE